MRLQLGLEDARRRERACRRDAAGPCAKSYYVAEEC